MEIVFDLNSGGEIDASDSKAEQNAKKFKRCCYQNCTVHDQPQSAVAGAGGSAVDIDDDEDSAPH